MKGYGIPKEIFHLDNSAEITISKNTKPIFSLNQHDLQDLTGTKNRLWVHHCLFQMTENGCILWLGTIIN